MNLKSNEKNNNEDNIKYKYVDTELEYKEMYNWTNDLPEIIRQNYIDIINYINGKNIENIKILEMGTYTGVSYTFTQSYK